ncbi:hypothetical protein A1355_04765 [Methylomonas koyamae]|uniref:Uncharacterized protein n=1 Tax=Methylomonas koyamae TaxID=702114 RepID=A0A177NPM6_9GAMM|nr:hypothetical protein A1355_04765 [Methylomonas koyamae]
MSRGRVWKKPNPKLRGDEQEPDMRRDTSGASGHVTAKPSALASCVALPPASLQSSIYDRDVFCKSGVRAAKETCLTPGGLQTAFGMKLDDQQRVAGFDCGRFASEEELAVLRAEMSSVGPTMRPTGLYKN